MSISSNSIWQLYANQAYSAITGTPALQATSAVSSQTTSSTGSIQGVGSSSLDSFQLSGTSDAMSAGLYGPPPPMPLDNSSSASSSTSSSSSDTLMSDIQSFLSKAADGTVTDSDLTALESELQSAGVTGTSSTSSSSDSSTVASTSSSTGSGNLMSDIQSFLSKAADGTATDSDLTALESELQSAQQSSQQFAPPPPPVPPDSSASTSSSSASSGSDTLMNDIQSFLAKAAAGTVTQSDLTSLESELQSAGSATSTSQV